MLLPHTITRCLKPEREVFLEAMPHITDDEGKWLLDLHLRMSAMVLEDCGVFIGENG